MDEIWDGLGCDPAVMDERVAAFYAHPVWLLNGLFIEQHAPSLANRRVFTDWVLQHAPRRVADYGGGYGTLARMIGAACPEASVEVIEPHAHPAAIARAATTANVRYRAELAGKYDILMATDVFEHVPDPLELVYVSAQHLYPGGQYVIANCFWPVIKCHLPQTFHLRDSWDKALAAMGLLPAEPISYGKAYIRQTRLDLAPARVIERRSRRLAPWLERLNGRVGRRAARCLLRTIR